MHLHRKSQLKRILLQLVTLLSLLSASFGWSAILDHGQWDQLLKAHVRVIEGGRATQVDYKGMATERHLLTAYLQQLGAVTRSEFDQWTETDQLAFLINAYNAWTLELILTQWPELDSIKELGSLFSSPWSKRFIPLLGKDRSLDEIEHDLIRGSERYKEPRIHFAVNCASIGCPALRAEAFQGTRLDAQLEDQTRLFLSDRSRNRWDDGKLQLSAIFKWYREDFETGWRATGSLPQFLRLYAKALGLTPSQQQQLLTGQVKIRFLNYDWRLNSTVKAEL